MQRCVGVAYGARGVYARGLCAGAGVLTTAHTITHCLTLHAACPRDTTTPASAEIEAFNSTVHSLVELLSTQAEAIEREKLRAIGVRNLAESEPENRERRKKEIRALIAEKNSALDRLTRQYESLAKVEAEQKALIEKLSNNEA